MDWRENLISLVEKRKFKGVIFDFDGTLYHLSVNWDGLKKEIQTHFQLEQETSLASLFLLIQKQFDNASLYDAYAIVEQFEKENIAKIPMLEENKKLLALLQKQTKLAIFSNNMTSTIEDVLRKNKVDHYFDIVIGKDKVTRYKPDPEGLTKIIDYWNCSISDVFFVGDSIFDEQIAEKSGVDFLHV